jgi:hypothetical protein
MIVDQIDLVSVAILEAKDDPPVAGHGYAPEALQIALQGMETIARESHLLRSIDNIQPGKDVLDPVQLIGPHLLPIAAQEQTS